ncbi:hypothetical protein BJ741DRAFT_600702 [Chytriomyces cf. hyalinus JEL632]|nr:hypothetical protein BJ741DRAFT_600702 [Chytriomyces cf. hyalinus JEL632]
MLSHAASEAATKSVTEWLSHCLSNPIIHTRTGVRVHLMGSSALAPPQSIPAMREAFSKLAPSAIAVDTHPTFLPSLQQHSHLLKDSFTALNGKESIDFVRANKGRITVPTAHFDAWATAGLVPFAAEAVAMSHHSKAECLQHQDIVQAEEMARNAADMRARRKEEDDDIYSNQVSEDEAQADQDLRNRLTTLFEGYGLSESMLRSFKTNREDANLVDAEIQSMVMGPTLTSEYQTQLSEWISIHPSAKTRFGVFDMIRKAKVETIVGKLGVMCIKNVANGYRDRPVLAVVDRKLLAEVADALSTSKK